MLAHGPAVVQLVKRRSGTRRCVCGTLISANKRKCLGCLTGEVRKNLEAQGHEVDEEEVRRLTLVFATSGH